MAANPLVTRIAELPAAKRALLLARLAERAAAVGRSAPGDRSHGGADAAPRLSYAQERLWVLEQLEPGGHDYNIARAFQWDGPLDVTALATSLQALARRHDVLRTVIDDASGTPVPVILPDGPAPLTTIDISHLPEPSRAQALERLFETRTRGAFDLRVGPLWNVLLVTLAPERQAFLVVVHHIVFDGASMSIFLDELGMLYREARTGRPAMLPALTSSYAALAARQRERLSGSRPADLTGYWTSRLAGAPPELTLPLDFARPPVKTHNGAIELRALPAGVAAALREVGQGRSVTMFMLVAAAFSALLAQYAGQDDITIGTPVSGRLWPESEGVVGLFINTVVLRTDLAGDPTFVELLERVRSSTLDAMAHQDLPFDRVVEALHPVRTLNRTPLFQVMLAMQSAVVADPRMDGLTGQRISLARRTSLFDLELTATYVGDALNLALEYDSDLFEPRTAARMLDGLCRLLEGVAARPERRVSELLTVNEPTRGPLAGFNSGARVAMPERLIHDLFEARAAKTPEAIAVECAGRQLTYRALDEQANQLARHLQSMGAGAERCVPVCLDRALDTIVALLGVWKAGAVYVPIDPSLPAERMEALLRDTNAHLVLTRAALAPRIPSTGARIVALDTQREVIGREPITKPPDGATPDSLAYIIYTSGSTGQPKGVAVAHAPAALHLDTIRRDFGYRPDDRVLQFASLSFDVSIEQILAPLFCGATLVLEQDTLWDRAEFPIMTAWLGLTVINVPPAYWAQLAQDEALTGFGPLRLIIVGGDTMPIHIVKRWQESRAAKPELLNAYGPTETVMTATLYPVPAARPTAGEPARIPIGAPLANRTAYVLTRHGRQAPEGVWGELYFGGDLLARGYWNDPVLTAERFVPDPFGAAGGRLYRTGDIGRVREHGVLEFLGRQDGQVKIRGYRIELGDVERAVYAEAGVAQAAVVVKTRPSGERQLIAYVECTPETGDDGGAIDQVRAGVRTRLPEYMCPSQYVRLARFPRTASGKLDRQSLPEPEAIDAGAAPHVAPRTANEGTLTGIWAAVLGLPRVSVTDNFFEIGGDSILGLQIVARARQAGLALTPRQLFQHQTIAELARAAEPAAAATGDAAGEPAPASGALPLTPIQRWFFAQAGDEVHHYNQAFLFEPRPGLQFDGLARALAAIVTQHDALRLRFDRAAGGWSQRYADADEGQVALARIDLRAAADPDTALRAAIVAEHTRLDITHGPLLRATWFDLGDARGARLLIVVHHLAVDGVSWRILLEDLAAAYAQLAGGVAVCLPPRTSAYRRWADSLTAYARSAALVSERTWWRREAQAPADDLRIDDPTGGNTVADEERLVSRLSVADTSRLLTEAGKAYNTQMPDALLSALIEALHRWQGLTSLRVAVEGHGREDLGAGLDLTRTVGWFTSLYPVRLAWRDGEALGARLQRVKAQLRAIPRHGLGYGVLRYLVPDASLDCACPLTVNYLGQLDQAMGRAAWLPTAREGSGPPVSAAFSRASEIDLNALVIDGQLQLAWTYSHRRQHRETINALADHYGDCLRELIDHCTSSSRDLDVDDVQYVMRKLSAAAH
jgi:amino acid adenylation domain-containing protein/non-ribosomal peptide synthase protein (TIGR01720 family)